MFVEFTGYAPASRLRASWMEARVTKLARVVLAASWYANGGGYENSPRTQCRSEYPFSGFRDAVRHDLGPHLGGPRASSFDQCRKRRPAPVEIACRSGI